MKIVGGSFGVKGSAFISRDLLAVEGARKADYSSEQIQSVSARVEAEKQFGLFGALVGGVLLSVVGFVFLGVIGVIGGVILAIAGSFYSVKKNLADVAFTDGSTLTLECTPRAMEKLIQFSGR